MMKHDIKKVFPINYKPPSAAVHREGAATAVNAFQAVNAKFSPNLIGYEISTFYPLDVVAIFSTIYQKRTGCMV